MHDVSVAAASLSLASYLIGINSSDKPLTLDLTLRRVRAVSVAAASLSLASRDTPSTASVYLDSDLALQ